MQDVKHGLRYHALYGTWANMRNRCNNSKNKDYHRYGERDIKVCKRWDNFALFLADMGEKPSPQHTLDRIDNNGNYEPNNCRWATHQEQIHNSRAAKLTPQKAKEIRQLYATGTVDQKVIGSFFNINQSNVSRVVNSRTW